MHAPTITLLTLTLTQHQPQVLRCPRLGALGWNSFCCWFSKSGLWGGAVVRIIKGHIYEKIKKRYIFVFQMNRKHSTHLPAFVWGRNAKYCLIIKHIKVYLSLFWSVKNFFIKTSAWERWKGRRGRNRSRERRQHAEINPGEGEISRNQRMGKGGQGRSRKVGTTQWSGSPRALASLPLCSLMLPKPRRQILTHYYHHLSETAKLKPASDFEIGSQ